MRPTSVFVACLLTSLAVGCSTDDPIATSPSSTAAAIPVDLSDPSVQRALGSPPPEGIVWQRQAGDITIVGKTAAAAPNEVELISAALADIPPQLLSVGEPRFIVRVPNIAGTETLAGAVTVTFGPDIYLLDETFTDGRRDTSRIDMTFALAHELAHVAQWHTLSDAYVDRVLTGEVPQVRLGVGSTAVREWAAAVGWVDESAEPGQPRWRLDQGAAPTSYAATSPVEDLADTVALVAIGRANWVDETRLAWVTSWLGAEGVDLSAGMPWVPRGAEEVISPTPLFDEPLASELARDRSATHIEPVSFVWPDAAVAEAADELESQLRLRGLDGTLGSVGDSPFPRRQGTFVRSDGVVFLVELWNYPGDGEEEIVLTYVVIW